jgi:hypothetical protein
VSINVRRPAGHRSLAFGARPNRCRGGRLAGTGDQHRAADPALIDLQEALADAEAFAQFAEALPALAAVAEPAAPAPGRTPALPAGPTCA